MTSIQPPSPQFSKIRQFFTITTTFAAIDGCPQVPQIGNISDYQWWLITYNFTTFSDINTNWSSSPQVENITKELVRRELFECIQKEVGWGLVRFPNWLESQNFSEVEVGEANWLGCNGLLLLLLFLPFPGVIVCFHIEWRWGTRSMCHWRSKANQSCWGWAQNSLLQSLPTINLSEPQSDFYLIFVILISNLRSWSTQRRVVVLASSSSSRCRLYSHLDTKRDKICSDLLQRELRKYNLTLRVAWDW